MKKILIVRLSAMGDIVHVLPSISDIHRRWPNAQIDLAVDARFADIVAAHHHVTRVIALPLKRWKSARPSLALFAEIAACLRELRQEHYDVVLDLHGLIKSALVTRLARAAQHCGPAWTLCAEKLAWLAYGRHCTGDWGNSPVRRMRNMTAQLLDTDTGTPPDFGLASAEPIRGLHVVLVHASSRDDKLWPESNWIALGRALRAQNLEIILPWGSPAEEVRALRLVAAIGGGEIPEQATLADWIDTFSRAALVVGVDTGLTHLAAACSTPCLALFSATDPALFCPQNPEFAQTVGGPAHPPLLGEVWQAAMALLGSEEIALPHRAYLRPQPDKVRRKTRLLTGVRSQPPLTA